MNARTGSLPWDLSGRAKTPEEYKEWVEERKRSEGTDMKSSHKALCELVAVVTELAEIVRDLDPGRTRQYDLIAALLEKARGHITRAKAFE